MNNLGFNPQPNQNALFQPSYGMNQFYSPNMYSAPQQSYGIQSFGGMSPYQNTVPTSTNAVLTRTIEVLTNLLQGFMGIFSSMMQGGSSSFQSGAQNGSLFGQNGIGGQNFGSGLNSLFNLGGFNIGNSQTNNLPGSGFVDAIGNFANTILNQKFTIKDAIGTFASIFSGGLSGGIAGTLSKIF
jgi:hypothetical protein